MNLHKKLPFTLPFLLLCCFLFALSACHDKNTPEYRLSVHPRLLLEKGDEKQLLKTIESNQLLNNIHHAILAECNNLLGKEALERNMVGRRLLGTSREVLRRVFYLSYAFRLTGDEAYFIRAEKEMLSAAGFSDWNPAHFLDVAEMTMALAIGYDWLYNRLSEESKELIRDAILKKGLEPSFDDEFNWFLEAHHNWNQVCNAGITYGALAIFEDHPETAKAVIDRAFETIGLAMDDYEPDGAYPEGYGYWNYGTSFNVMFLSAVDKIWPGRFDYNAYAAFMKTGSFTKNMLTPSGNSFNWGDNGPGGFFSPVMYWFADKNRQPSLLWQENSLLSSGNEKGLAGDRLLPALMIWGRAIPGEQVAAPDYRLYVGQGSMPVAAMRTSWSDTNAIFLGFKGGSPSVNHGHMDVGSFVLEADGVRWATDPGPQNYNSLELLGMDIWDRTQDSERWKVLRLNNFIHNTLTVDGALQLVDGHAIIDRYAEKQDLIFAISDISALYAPGLASAVRGACIVNNEFVVIRDELKAGNKKANVRWQMLTEATVAITGEQTATLSKDGKILHLRIDAPAGARLATWSSQPVTTYDEMNPGTILVGFETSLQADAGETLQVTMIPGPASPEAHFNKDLADWK